MKNNYTFNPVSSNFLIPYRKLNSLKRLSFITAALVLLFNIHADAVTTPSSVIIYNFGDTAQLTFNNAVIYTSTPVFRVASSGGSNPTNFQIEINTLPTFTGTDFLQNFAGSYISGTQYNLTFNNGFTPDSGTTYYARAAASADSGNTYSSYSSVTYSFTYQSSGSTAWYQTTQAQFQSDSLSGTTATSDSGIKVSPGNMGTNVFTNASFESGLSSWTVSVSGSGISSTHYTGIATSGTNSINGFPFTPPSPSPVTDGTHCMVLCNDAGGFDESFENGDYVAAQTGVDLTGISAISFSQTFSDWAIGGCSGGVYSESYLEVIIDPDNSSHGTAGTVVYMSSTWTGACLAEYTTVSSGPTTKTINLPAGTYGANCSVKFAFFSETDAYSTFTDAPTVYIDNVQSSSSTLSGTIISTPVVLASVQGASNWSQLQWNQTLNGGTITLDVQKSINGVWTDEGDISSTGDGANTFDISFIAVTTSYDSIRIVATLTATDSTSPSLNSWTVTTNSNITTGTHELLKTALSAFNAYPNPATDELHFDFYNIEGKQTSLEIFNNIGQSVFNADITTPNILVSLKNVSDGIYLARLVSTDNSQSLKILVSH